MIKEASGRPVEISIIIPVYNVKPYLDECLRSVLAQTYRDLEVLLVDDGSTDGSGDICDSYAERYDNVRVFHQENQGQGPARNLGIKNARGNYLGFVDSDDTIEPDMLQALHEAAQHEKAQIAMCGRFIVHPDGTRETLFTQEQPETMTGAEALRRLLLYQNIDSSPCDKLFSAVLLHDLLFPSGMAAEDIAVVYLTLSRADRLVHIGSAKYDYRKREGSTSRSIYTSKTKGMLIYPKKVWEFCYERYPQYCKEADAFLCYNVAEAAKCYYRTTALKEYQSLMHTYVKEAFRCCIGNRYIPRRRKLELAAQRFHLYPMIHRVHWALLSVRNAIREKRKAR